MLAQLRIQNFAIINDIDITFKSGMTVFTGETGAGKSIMIDALLLALGGRAESSAIQPNKERCVITAEFDITQFTPAQEWLKQHELDENSECILRRIISMDGRSRGFINSQSVPMQLLREFGNILINIHGQHEHQNLLKSEKQRRLLDAYANHHLLLAKLEETYIQWQTTQQELTELQKKIREQRAREELLKYQLDEFDKLALNPSEYTELDQEQKQLAHAEQLISSCQTVSVSLSEDDNTNISKLINYCCGQLSPLLKIDNSLTNIYELLTQAQLQIHEASKEIQHYISRTELNPERLLWVEERLSNIIALARKHHTTPENIFDVHEQLMAEFNAAETDQNKVQTLEITLNNLKSQYLQIANKLSKSRKKAAKQLAGQVENRLQQLAMPGSKFSIQVTELEDFAIHGMDRIEFQVSTNPGQSLQNLNKVVSGGELSRISLALHVLTAQSEIKPTLIFDEVDTGIGGATAEVVGRLLQELSQTVQLLCVTHLPQVASLAKNHLRVSKKQNKTNALTVVDTLNNEEKIHEIARMLSGVKITDQTLAHAREMLAL